MTWYTYRNYGTALQASALYHTIRELGYDPDMIRYLPRGYREEPKMTDFRFWLDKIKNKLSVWNNRPYHSQDRDMLFRDYLLDHITETQYCASLPELKELNEIYDAFVCGSDQIWSLQGFEDPYFLPFVSDPNKKIAYAPSMGQTGFLREEKKLRFLELIRDFRHLSVREEQGAKLIRELTGKEVKVALDPTLLMNSRQWDAFIRKNTPHLTSKPYILCYFLGDSQRYMAYVRKLSVRMDMPYYVIPIAIKEARDDHAIPFAVGPEEFVSLIRDAAFVCTDSFHGTAFSINYNIPFCVFQRFRENDSKSQNSRIIHLLHKTGLESRLVKDCRCHDVARMVQCDYSEANRRLARMRTESIAFLKNALEEATGDHPSNLYKTDCVGADYCCGCGACAAVCPVSAIQMEVSDEGFWRCRVDHNCCIHCGRCAAVCPMENISAGRLKESPGLYCAQSKSDAVLAGSSSGGIGFELADYFHRLGYLVCGAAYHSDINRTEHILIHTHETEQLKRLQGSKYIQSRTDAVMKQLWNDSGNDPILFFGTPCQTAAFDKLLRLKKIRDRGILVDLICHGVPSINLWDRQIEQMNRISGIGEHPAVSFRSRADSGKLRMLRAEGNGKIYLSSERKDDFYGFFRRGLCHMDTCYSCPYRERSGADLRIGDYWGIDSGWKGLVPSMVIANTEKGQQIIRILRDQNKCTVAERPISEYWRVQHPYNVSPPLVRDQLILDLQQKQIPLSVLRQTYCRYYDLQEQIQRWKARAKKLLKKRM